MTDTDIVLFLKEASPAVLKAVTRALSERFGREMVEIALRQNATAEGAENPFARGAIRACDLPPAEEPVRLWLGLYPRSVALFIGESGAGKSSLLYNLGIHAARNEPLWGVKFGLHRPLKVLYVDPENSGNYAEGQGGQTSVKIERIGQGSPIDLVFHDGQGVNLANTQHVQALSDYIQEQKFDVVILDPIANLFGTKDENDNAEAARQMTAITALSRQTGACIVVVHHTGKNTTGDYGRGASARFGAADVVFVFRAKSDTEEVDDNVQNVLKERDDQCRLQIVKNRLEGRGSLYLQMGGEDKFNVSNFENWKHARRRADSEVSKAVQAEEEIKLYLADNLWHTRAEIVDAMKKEDIGRISVDAALEILFKDETITSKRTGRGGSTQYILTSAVQVAVKASRNADGDVTTPGHVKGTRVEDIKESVYPGDLILSENPLNDTFFDPKPQSPQDTPPPAPEEPQQSNSDEEGWK